MKRMHRALLLTLLVATGCAGRAPHPLHSPADAPVGPVDGALIIAGGGALGPKFIGRFVELAGGLQRPGSSSCPVPASRASTTTAGAVSSNFARRAPRRSPCSTPGTATSPTTPDSRPTLREATGVWIPGGRQWRLTEVYLGTRTHRELHDLLERGGVIGGTSAGASVQGSFMVRGAPEGNHIVVAPGRTEGFGFLRGVAVDQHLRARNREYDMLQVLEVEPELLGFGIDEGTAVVVRSDRATVVGSGFVAVYNAADAGYAPFYFLRAGDVFDLARRVTLSRSPRCISEETDERPRRSRPLLHRPHACARPPRIRRYRAARARKPVRSAPPSIVTACTSTISR
jgi:cyanophycinase